MAVDLAEILSMLKERSQRGRNLVFRHVADLFLAGKVPHLSGDRATLLEILRILRPKVDIGVRRELSGHLYSMEHPPQGLLDLLLDDVDEVSGPLLDYAAIPEQTMIRLTEEAPIEVISRLKRRHDLPPRVRARIDDRFAKPRAPRETVQPQPEPVTAPAPDVAAQREQEPAAVAAPAKPDKPASAAPPEFEELGHIPAIQAPYYPDIAALGETLADMARRNTEFRDFVRTSSEWQWETDREGRITYLSDGAARALGRPVSSLLERPLTEVIQASEGTAGQEAAVIWQALDRRSAFDELAIATQGFDGTCAWKLAAVPVFDLDSGRFQGYRGVAEAMTSLPALGLPANSNAPRRRAKSETPESGFDRGVADAIQGLSL